MATMPTRADLKKNLKALRARLEERPMDLDARMRVARTYRLLGTGKEAVAHYRHVARYLSLSGHPLQAIAVLKELLQVDPHHEETLLFLAKLYARTRAADTSNTGRVAVPILDEDTGAIALPEGLPLSGTGIWRAIRPQATDVYAVIHDAGDAFDDHDDVPRDRNSATHEIMGGEVLEEIIVEAEDIGAEVLSVRGRPEVPRDADVAPVADEGDDADDDEGEGVTADIAPPAHLLKRSKFPMGSESFDVDSLAPSSARTPSEGASEANTDVPDTFDVDGNDDDAFLEYSSSDFLEDVNPEDVVLPQVPLFASLSPEAVVDLGHAMVFQRATIGETIFAEGDPGDSCIVIASGTAVVSRKGDDGEEIQLTRLSEGEMGGLFALVLAENRLATLKAETYVEYFEIDREAIDALVERHPQVKDTLAALVRDRLIVNLLAVLPVFGQLTTEERHDLSTQFKTKRYEIGDALFARGDEFDGLWIVLEGRVRIDEGLVADPTATGEGALEIGPGEFAGSFAGTDAAECDRTAICLSPTVVAVLPQRELTTLMEKIPDATNVRDAFVERGLMVAEHVYAGNGRAPGALRDLKRIF